MEPDAYIRPLKGDDDYHGNSYKILLIVLILESSFLWF